MLRPGVIIAVILGLSVFMPYFAEYKFSMTCNPHLKTCERTIYTIDGRVKRNKIFSLNNINKVKKTITRYKITTDDKKNTSLTVGEYRIFYEGFHSQKDAVLEHSYTKRFPYVSTMFIVALLVVTFLPVKPRPKKQ